MNLKDTVLKYAKKAQTRVIAGITALAVAVCAVGVVNSNKISTEGAEKWSGDTTDSSWDDTWIADNITRYGYYPTAINYGAILGYPTDGETETYGYWCEYNEGWASDRTFIYNFKQFNDDLMYCVDQHATVYNACYSQAFVDGLYSFQNGIMVNDHTGSTHIFPGGSDNLQFSELMLAAALGYRNDHSKLSDEEFLDQTMNLRGIIYIITDYDGFVGDWDKDLETYRSYKEDNAPHGADYATWGWGWRKSIPTTNNTPVEAAALAAGCTTFAEQVFFEIWNAAAAYNNTTPTKGKTVKLPDYTTSDGAATSYHYVFGTGLISAGLPNLLSVNITGGSYTWDTTNGELIVTVPAGSTLEGTLSFYQSNWDDDLFDQGYIPNLADADIAVWRYYYYYSDAGGEAGMDVSQRFMSVDYESTYSVELSPSDITIQRYDHTETWAADYNVELVKYDSETGMPLSDSYFDILEMFNDNQLDDTTLTYGSGDKHDELSLSYISTPSLNLSTWESDENGSSSAGTSRIARVFSDSSDILSTSNTLRNWYNDHGTQFDYWDDYYSDPCNKDNDRTGNDGYLYTTGSSSGTKAHKDTRSYTYNKGYCGGHPAPEITYLPLPDDDEDDDYEEIWNYNQSQYMQNWTEWYKEVDTCYKLASEGGYFHSITPGAAQAAMEADRDEYYQDFISLVYDYSAVEKTARAGYILHGYHTDDIPIEWRTVTSSQYKEYQENGGSLNSGSGSGSDSGYDDNYDYDSVLEKYSATATPSDASSVASEDYDDTAGVSDTEDKAEAAEDADITEINGLTETEDGGLTETDAVSSDSVETLGSEDLPDDNVQEIESDDYTSDASSDVSSDDETGPEETEDSGDFEESPESAGTESSGNKELSEEESDEILSDDEEENPEDDTDAEENSEDDTDDEETAIQELSGKRHFRENEEDALEDDSYETEEPSEDAVEELSEDYEDDSYESLIDENDNFDDEPAEENDSSEDFRYYDTATDSDAEREYSEDDKVVTVDEDGFIFEDILYYAETVDLEEVAEEADVEYLTVTIIRNFVETPKDSGIRTLRDDDDDEWNQGDTASGSSGSSLGDLHVTYVIVPSIASKVNQFNGSIIDWTFIVYDHRTEGEIHFNKRDFYLNNSENEDYDSYADSNGDGSLEGAVYGLFAAVDIVHPDSNGTENTSQDTGIVYKEGDLVAIATTDRNGDGSFMTFTEAPGMTYDYQTGQVVKNEYSDSGSEWNGPTNLHRQQSDAAKVNDIEVFKGYNPDNSPITAGNGEDLIDTSDSSGSAYTEEWYKKYSTNQEWDTGLLSDNRLSTNNGKPDTYRMDNKYTDLDEADTTGYYPIQNNEDNNGNCWIGRPIIVSGSTTVLYYIKELSRSEGYELSVSGKDTTVTNYGAEFDDKVNGSTLSYGGISTGQNNDLGSYDEFTVTSTGTTGYIVTVENVPVEPTVYAYISYSYYDEEAWNPDYPIDDRYVIVGYDPVYATPGTFVYINGKKVEVEFDSGGNPYATLPDGTEVELSKDNLYYAEASTLYMEPYNMQGTSITWVADTTAITDTASFINTFNGYLSGQTIDSQSTTSVYMAKELARQAPYVLIPLEGTLPDDTTVPPTAGTATNYSWTKTIGDYIADYLPFNRFYLSDIIGDNDTGYTAVLHYSYICEETVTQEIGGQEFTYTNTYYPICLYDSTTGIIYQKVSITYVYDNEEVSGYLYIPYTSNEYETDESTGGIVILAHAEQKYTSVDEIHYPDEFYNPSDGSSTIFTTGDGAVYWIYAGEYDSDGNIIWADQARNNDGYLISEAVYDKTDDPDAYGKWVESEHGPLKITDMTYDASSQTLTFTVNIESIVEGYGEDFYLGAETECIFRITYEDKYTSAGAPVTEEVKNNGYVYVIKDESYSNDSTFIINDILMKYPGQETVIQDAGTIETPLTVLERPLTQSIRVSKSIITMENDTSYAWFCSNCGYENTDISATTCEFCGYQREADNSYKKVEYAHDTYSAVHSDNLSADGSGTKTTDWLTSLLNGTTNDSDKTTNVSDFRFKAYLKSNLERLYRDENGEIHWVDRNGNYMTPQYDDTNGDGNYDTFHWTYDTAYDGKTVDFPEQYRVNEDGELEASNVQKIYTEVQHNTSSETTSGRANNVWSIYEDPQDSYTTNVGEKEGFNTSERPTLDSDRKETGTGGDETGKAIYANASLYSYKGNNTNVAKSDKINEDQNKDYTRLLETTLSLIEDGEGTREVETYNYQKFFDAIYTANTDVWDDDMHSTYTINADGSVDMSNYPGQNWFDTFDEKYQMDDADPDHTIENTDGADSDGTAGGDRDTSFKPFAWIRENIFGVTEEDKNDYPATHNNENTENTINTSDYARKNAEASDAVRQFAEDWYLEDEVAKLVKNNGYDEDEASIADYITGTSGEEYQDEVYDIALYNALGKAYNYLKPFYMYDLDTIYSIEWDSEPYGGSDNDYTTLAVNDPYGSEYYSISAYLPYGTYVIVEQQPERIDNTNEYAYETSVNDWKNRSFSTEAPKEIIVPSVYDAEQSNNTADNYDSHYFFTYDMTLEDQASYDNYLIRFGEEWAHNNEQDERNFVIRAHNYDGDFEVYKYGLDYDRIWSETKYPAYTDNVLNYTRVNGSSDSYSYLGYSISQHSFDPLKRYYNVDHRGEEGIDKIGTENGGYGEKDENPNHYFPIDGTNGILTANADNYDSYKIADRYFYGSISEDAGFANNVLYTGGDTTTSNNMDGMYFEDKVRSVTGQLTAYEGKYAPMLVPWSMVNPSDVSAYDASKFTGYADANMRDEFYTSKLRINKTDSETGEYILHDGAVFSIYAASRYQTFDEIAADAELITDEAEREKFLKQFKPGDAKFYLQDTDIYGTMEFLMSMGAYNIRPTGTDTNLEAYNKDYYVGTVAKGTPICVEDEKIMLTDEKGNRYGQMTVYTTTNDVKLSNPEDKTMKLYANQNTGYLVTPEPLGAGVYVLAEVKAPNGYMRSKPVAYEVYSDGIYYYADGDMYHKVEAVVDTYNLVTQKENDEKYKKVTVSITDSDDNPLPYIQFKIYHDTDDDENLMYQGSTDNNGIRSVELLPGTYVIHVLRLDSGYAFSPSSQTFTVEDDLTLSYTGTWQDNR